MTNRPQWEATQAMISRSCTGNTLYFSAFTQQYATELWAYNILTQNSWLVEDIHLGSSANPGWYMHFIHNDVLYFTARDAGNVHDLWAHNQSNGTTWKVEAFGTDPNTHPGNYMDHLIGENVYFDALNEILGRELKWLTKKTTTLRGWFMIWSQAWSAATLACTCRWWLVMFCCSIHPMTVCDKAHDTSNGSTWRVMQHLGTNPGEGTRETVVGRTAFFQASGRCRRCGVVGV